MYYLGRKYECSTILTISAFLCKCIQEEYGYVGLYTDLPIFFFFFKQTQTCYRNMSFVLLPGVGMWGCFTAADYDLSRALAGV